VSSAFPRRPAFGLSIGSILASFIIIGGVQVLVAGLRAPLSLAAVRVINWVIGKTATNAPLLHIGSFQWSLVVENLVLSVLFVATGLAVGSWLRRSPR
jgi:hypothetical protein